MYQLTTPPSTSIIRLSDGALVPVSSDNPDYREYLEWLKAGNTPDPAPAPGPDYIAFWDALTTSTLYSAIREQSFTSLLMNTLATELISLLGDAKAGRPNESAIQNSMDSILSIGSFTPTHITELQAALVSGNLDNTYVLPAPEVL
jgi:hypothetical protein